MRHTLRENLSTLLLCIVLTACIGSFVAIVNPHYPIQTWLCWHYMGFWLACALWAASCASAGYFLLGKLAVRGEPGHDLLELAFPLGVFAFQLAIFLLGLVHLLRGPMFFLLPLVFLASGATRLTRVIEQRYRRAQRFSHRDVLVLLFGIAGVACLYFQILSPETFGHDARQYHLPIAQQYAIDGAVQRWPEGWWPAAYPHLASYLYTWAFMLPGGIQFDKFELAIHLEFTVFLATMASLPALVRRLAPNLNTRGTWVVIFLFPGIFLYDSNLNGAADHIAALWAIPIAIMLIRLWQNWDLRDCLLWAVFISAAAITKYTAFYIVAFPTVAFALRALVLFVRGKRFSTRFMLMRDFSLAVVAGLALTSTHWLKNWIWYGDPLYPALHGRLTVRPWNPDSLAQFDLFSSFVSVTAPGIKELKEALACTMTFSFVPNDWPVLHRDVPVFGSLFTLTLFCLPFVRARKSLWSLYLAVLTAVFVFYLVGRQDRYLQVVLPWMAACVAASLLLAWQKRHFIVRTLIVGLVAVQVLWGGDVPFFPTHNLLGDSPIRHVSNFLASGFLRTPHRFRFFGDPGEMGEALPKDARILLHNIYPASVGVHFVNDLWQGRINYGMLGSPYAIYRELSDLNVNYVAWATKTGLAWTSLAHDLAFSNFAANFVVSPRIAGTLSFGKMPSAAPPKEFNDRVAISSCGSPHRSGWYSLKNLGSPVPGHPEPSPESSLGDLSTAAELAGFLVVDPKCSPVLPVQTLQKFQAPFSRPPYELYVRKVGS